MRVLHPRIRSDGVFAHAIATYDKFYMGHLAHASISNELEIDTVNLNVRIRIQGLPEDVQWIADALEVALPGAMDWHSFADTNADNLVEINGVGHKFSMQHAISS